MKEKIRKKISKQIICIIVTLMLCNFIVPNYSYAVSTEFGGSLVEVISQFVCAIPDAVIEFLQREFVSDQGIQPDLVTYKIKYAPGTIFSGEIPAFSINFIKPKEEQGDIYEIGQIYSHSYDLEIAVEEAVPQILSSLGYVYVDSDIDTTIKEICNFIEDTDMDSIIYNGKPPHATTWSIEGKNYILQLAYTPTYSFKFYLLDEISETEEDRTIQITETYSSKNEKQDALSRFKEKLRNCFGIDNNNDNDVHFQNLKNLILEKEDEINRAYNEGKSTYETIVKYNNANAEEEAILIRYNIYASEDYRYIIGRRVYKLKTDSKIQEVIATWYNALRRVALVGLLSILVYIGIRIVLTSTSAKEKAKYKAMLKDWLVALCMLFALHYLMNITITVVDKINEIMGISVIGPDGEDILMSSVRNYVRGGEGDNWGTVLAYLVIYCTLAVYTVIFTVQYLRRVIYLAFLTMIAPLITLTYPLDKIKDKKSQAFDMWLKDYIFFSLLQVLHLLIYYIFLGSALNLAHQGNWIYSIVAIGFMTKAEKIMKKMFGFEKSKSMGALAAGATGALVSNAINKVKGFSGKIGKSGGGASRGGNTGSSGEGSSSNVRTATNNPLSAIQGAGAFGGGNSPSGTPTGGNSSSGSRASARGNNGGNSPSGMPIEGTPSSDGSNSSGSQASTGRRASSTGRKGTTSTSSSGGESWRDKSKRRLKGVAHVGSKYIGKNYKAIGGTALGILTGGAGAMIGFAAGVAQGDLGTAFGGAMAGGAAGMNLSKGAVNLVTGMPDKIKNTANDIHDTYIEGAYGEEYARNARIDKNFRNSSAYAKLKQDSGFEEKEFDEKVSQMLESGITDAKRMKKILKNHKKHPRKYSMEKAIAYSEIALKCPDEILYDNGKFIRYCQHHDIKITKDEIEKLKNCIFDFK